MQYGSSFNRSSFYNETLFQNRFSRAELEEKITLPEINIESSKKVADLKLKLVSTDIIIGYMNNVASQIPRIFSEPEFKLSNAVLSHERLRIAYAAILKNPNDTKDIYFNKFNQVLLSYYPEMLKVYRQFPTSSLKEQLIDYYEQLARKFTRPIALAILQVHPDTMDKWLRKKQSAPTPETYQPVEFRKPIDLASESISREAQDDNPIPLVKFSRDRAEQVENINNQLTAISLDTRISEISRNQKIIQNLADNGIFTLHDLFAFGQRNIMERRILNGIQISALNDEIKGRSEYYWYFFKKIEQVGFTNYHVKALLKFGIDSVYKLLKLKPEEYLQIVESYYPHKEEGNSGVATKHKEMQEFKQALLNARSRELVEKRITI